MSNCPQCHNPIRENQVICLNCGIQVKPLKKLKSSSNCKWVILIIVMVVVMFSVLFFPGLL